MIRDPRLFFGRAAELDAIWGYLRKDANVSIVAERRMGKSSVLWYVKAKAPDVLDLDESEVHYLDLELVADAQEFYNRLAEILGLAEDATTRDIERVLADRRVILCLDEFDRTANNFDAFPLDFFAVLRGLSQGPRLTLVVATKTPLIDFSATGGMTSPFYSIFPPTPITLGPLMDDEARELLTRTAARAEIRFDEETLTQAVHLAKGHPWHLQLIGSYLVEADLVWPEAERRFEEAITEINGQIGKPRPARGARPPGERSTLQVALVGGLGTFAALLGLLGSLTGSATAIYSSLGVMLITFALAAWFFGLLLRRV
jgi:hypothetical protein